MKFSPVLALAGAATAFQGTLTANHAVSGSGGQVTQSFVIHDNYTGSTYTGNINRTNGCSGGCGTQMYEVAGNDLNFSIYVYIYWYSDDSFAVNFNGQLDAGMSNRCYNNPCNINA